MLGAVTATPRAVVEEFYRRLNAGERDAPARFEPEIEWHWPLDTPGAGVFHGYEGIDRGFNLWIESWATASAARGAVRRPGEGAQALPGGRPAGLEAFRRPHG